MKKAILVAGATGATGRLVVEQLLAENYHVKALVRSPEKLSGLMRSGDNLTLIEGAILDLAPETLADAAKDCAAVISCLGHNLTLKGVFGPPRKLVTQSVTRLCETVRKNNPERPVRFILMNTTGNRNKDLREKRSPGETLVLGLIRLLIPPQSDNEKAADYLRTEIGQNDGILEWTAVRPDSLIDLDRVTDYDLAESPGRSPIFNPGKTSRINTAHFMTRLVSDDDLWNRWKGKMPVIYNRE